MHKSHTNCCYSVVLVTILLAGPIDAVRDQRSVHNSQVEAKIQNQKLAVTVRQEDGSYEIIDHDAHRRVLRATVGAQLDHQWLKSNEYPTHEISQSRFEDVLGRRQEIEVRPTGLSAQPDIFCFPRLYDEQPYGDIQVEIQNRKRKTSSVESIRSVEAVGTPASL